MALRWFRKRSAGFPFQDGFDWNERKSVKVPLILTTIQLKKHLSTGVYLYTQNKWGLIYMPELGGTLSCLIDVMRAQLVQQVTERPAGTQWLRETLEKQQVTETNIKFFDQLNPNTLFHTAADTWTDSFQVHWIQKLQPCGKLLAAAWDLTDSLTVFVVCGWGGVVLKGNGGAAAAKGLFKSQRSTAGKRIILFILPPFLIWHTFCHSFFFLSICPLPPPFIHFAHSFFLPLCGKFNGFLGSE